MINNINQLEKYIQPLIEQALKLTEDKIFEIVSQKIVDYYNEPVFKNPSDPSEPMYYNRTGRLLEELTASHIEKHGNEYSFTIGWNSEYLQFKYPSGFVTKKYGNVYNNVTGLDILNWINSSSHGGTVDGSHDYWDVALMEIQSLYGGVANLFKQNCKHVGIPIK